jgi:hypothetical protein
VSAQIAKLNSAPIINTAVMAAVMAAMTEKITRPMIERNTPTNPNIACPTCRMLRTV